MTGNTPTGSLIGSYQFRIIPNINNAKPVRGLIFMNNFEDWFYSLEGYHILAERFYCDLDNFAYCQSLGLDYQATEAKNDIIDWLRAAFEAGVESAKEKTDN
jgi:hypothetical protein